jgi:hypothetical protein
MDGGDDEYLGFVDAGAGVGGVEGWGSPVESSSVCDRWQHNNMWIIWWYCATRCGTISNLS